MPSPFPGMDPYLEDPALWPGVHDSVILYSRDALQPLLLPRYYVEIGERIYFEDSRDVIYPDATVHERRPAPDGGAVATPAPAAPDEPVVFTIEPRQRETFLEIRSVGAHEVVTVVEIISPANKYGQGRGRDEYREKQDQVLRSNANLVEIDLLRRGHSVVVAPPGELLTLSRWDYIACVSRASDRRHVEVYAVSARQRLPRVAIPVREPDPDVVLDLPAVFDRAYDNGAYVVRVDYNQPPSEPLRAEDEEWADSLLREAGLRGQGGGDE
jgi:uncharacterized protein DUF4058